MHLLLTREQPKGMLRILSHIIYGIGIARSCTKSRRQRHETGRGATWSQGHNVWTKIQQTPVTGQFKRRWLSVRKQNSEEQCEANRQQYNSNSKRWQSLAVTTAIAVAKH